MAFTSTIPIWLKSGTKPPDNVLNTDGWKPNDKPPADWLNWFFNSTYAALSELQSKAAEKTLATPTVSGLMPSADKTKLNGIATGANNYVHPATHPPSIIQQDSSNLFTTAVEKSNWNSKETPTGAQDKATAAEANAINFAKSFGLGDAATDISGTDLNNLDLTGFYNGNNLANSPDSSNFYFLINIKRNATTAYQILMRNSSVFYHEISVRIKNSGVWSSWKQLETTEGSQAKATSVRNELFDQSLLWSGAVYPMAADTITPSKKLSECPNGWILVWSDYDVGVGANDYQFVFTFVPKTFPTLFPGKDSYFQIPNYVSDTKNDTTIKQLTFTDSTIKGNDINKNATSQSDDAILRRVLAF